MIEITTHSPQETRKVGQAIASLLAGGEVIALTGPLGSGKTVLVKGIAAGLMIRQKVLSPSFLLLRPYPFHLASQKRTLYHFDLYRLKEMSELIEVGLSEILGNRNNVVVVEWAEKAKRLLPSTALKIKMKYGRTRHERIIELK